MNRPARSAKPGVIILTSIVLLLAICGCSSGATTACLTPPKAPNAIPSGTLVCVSGTISIDGSTALYPLADAVAQDYQAKCPGSTILVSKSSSLTGLSNVESGKFQIANSDLPALSSQGDLVDHRVAVVVFTIVINAGVLGVSNLTTQQLRSIYDGTLTNWKQVGGPDLSIVVLSRISSSGTRNTLQDNILCGLETLPAGSRHLVLQTNDDVAHNVKTVPGAIGYVDLGTAISSHLKIISIDGHAPLPDLVKQNSYKFWNVEHMYTKDIPAPDSLINTFIQYMTNTPTEELIAQSLSYVNFNTMTNSGLSNHQPCYSGM